ncbi:MAG: DUF2062 domain-containing protein [Pseudomonadota bacterium]
MPLGGRRKRSVSERAREFVWPRSGYSRSARYGLKRLMRVRASPHAIAAGFAAGAFASFTPLMGFHFILSALLALATRGSIIASAVGTAVGNPLTFPLIWAGTYKLGILILGGGNGAVDLESELSGGFFAALRDGLVPILLPMAVGGVLLGSIAWVTAYFPIRRIVAAYQTRRAARRAATEAAPAEMNVAHGRVSPDGLSAPESLTSDDPTRSDINREVA